MAQLDEDYRQRCIETWGNLPYSELAQLMEDLKAEHDRVKAAAAKVWAEYELLAQEIIPAKMDKDQIHNITIALRDGTTKRLQILDQLSVKTPKDNKLALWQWLREHDAEALITETVNSSTLAAFVREQIKNGGEIPSDICEITSWTTASLVKA